MSTANPQWPFAGAVYDTPRGPIQCDQLAAALNVPDLQKSVAAAIHRRLRKLGFVGLPS